MSALRWIGSIMGISGLALSLSAGACSGTGSGSVAGKGRDGGAEPTVSGATCTTNADCAGMMPTTTPAGCATGTCNALQGLCVFSAKDEDGDGHPANNCVSTNGVMIVEGDDCNDHDPNLYPGHNEACSTSPDGGTPAGALCAQGLLSCLPDGTESPCTDTVACVDQACVPASGGTAAMCVGACAPGQTRCDPAGAGVLTCEASGNWGSATSCGTMASCVSTSAGMAQCAGTCMAGAVTCGGNNGVQTCSSSGTWGNPVACLNSTCANGLCMGNCAPGQTSCSGNGVATCAAGGTWGAPAACVNQTCVGSSEGASGDGGTGAGNDATVSTDAGSAAGQSGSCQGLCTQYAVGCNGQQPQVCDATGNWQNSGATCDANHTCVNGSCTGVCGPGQTLCNGQQPQACSGSGQWQNNGQVCGSSQTCVGGIGTDAGGAATCGGSCSPGQTTCAGTQPQSCVGGTFQNSGASCSGSMPACYQGACVVCIPAAVGCGSGEQPQVCNSSGSAWQNSGAACTGNAPACLNGSCVTCTPGAAQCANSTQPQTCSATGAWQNTTACTGTMPYCNDAGVCGVCSNGSGQCSGDTPQSCVAGQWSNGSACTTTVADATPSCSLGSCTFVCNTSYSACGSGCVNEQVDPNNCNGCGSVCPYGLCQSGSCVASFHGAGYPNAGTGSHVSIGANTLLGDRGISAAGSPLVAIGAQTIEGGINLRLGLYTDNAGAPGTLLAQTGQLTSVANGRTEGAVSPSGVVLSATTNYWIMILTASNMHLATETPTVSWPYETGVTYGPLPATFSSTATPVSTNLGDLYFVTTP